MDSPKENFFKDLENIGGLKMTNGTNYGCKLNNSTRDGRTQPSTILLCDKRKKKRSLRL